MTSELSLARLIQLSLMEDSYSGHGFVAYAFYKPMNELGGDFYSFHNINEEEDSFFIADVSGHGAPAALIATLVKGLIDSYAAEVKANPALLFYKINQHIYGKIKNNFLTAFYGIYNKRNRTLKYSRAGHCLPYLLNEDLIELDAKGGIIGLDEHFIPPVSVREILPGERLILFTDGIIEVENERHETFEFLFKTICKKTKNLQARDALIHIQEELQNFKPSRKYEDDLCVVMIDFFETLS